jgi:hypothetical protein
VKAVKSGQRVNTTMDKTMKQVLVYAQYQQARAQANINNCTTAGKLWDGGNFETMKIDLYCKDIQEDLQAEAIPTRHVRLWRERWEVHVNGPNEDARLKECLMQKYGGLKLYDRGFNNWLLTCHKPYFQKRRGANRYCIFAVMEGYNPNKDDMEEGNYKLWTLWDLDEALYDCIQDYYKANKGEDGVVMYEKDTGVDSDHADDDSGD